MMVKCNLAQAPQPVWLSQDVGSSASPMDKASKGKRFLTAARARLSHELKRSVEVLSGPNRDRQTGAARGTDEL